MLNVTLLLSFSPVRQSGLLLCPPRVSHELVIRHPCQSPVRITCCPSSGPVNVLAHWFSRTCRSITFSHNTGLVYICRHRKKICICWFDLGELTSVKHTEMGKLTMFWVIQFFSVSVDDSYDHKLSCFPCLCFPCLLLLPPCSLSTSLIGC